MELNAEWIKVRDEWNQHREEWCRDRNAQGCSGTKREINELIFIYDGLTENLDLIQAFMDTVNEYHKAKRENVEERVRLINKLRDIACETGSYMDSTGDLMTDIQTELVWHDFTDEEQNRFWGW